MMSASSMVTGKPSDLVGMIVAPALFRHRAARAA